MGFTIVTWNINSVRLRAPLWVYLLHEKAPDILCLQECKCTADLIPRAQAHALGYKYFTALGQKSYNGVAIFSKLPFTTLPPQDFVGLGHARYTGILLENKIKIHNFYVPAGGDIPDRKINVKFGQKLDYLIEMRDWFKNESNTKSILVGDLNIAPQDDDVWSHKQLLNIVSHSPIEIDHLNQVMEAGKWRDVTRQDIPKGKLYSWWSYRARDWEKSDRGRRLDHIWASEDIAGAAHGSFILKEARGWEKPSDHAPVFANFDL